MTLTALGAVRASWGPDVCEDPADVPRWSPSNPARGQCGPTALVVNDLLGGELCVAEVRRPDGSRQGFHWWNRLAGVDIELAQPRVPACPAGMMKRGQVEYQLLRSRVLTRLAAEAEPGGQA